MKNVLAKELKTFESNKRKLLRKAKGKFVLIKGDKVLGIFADKNEAIDAGYRQLGYVPFLVKQILKVEPPIYLLASPGA